jgi:hypothetical protein
MNRLGVERVLRRRPSGVFDSTHAVAVEALEQRRPTAKRDGAFSSKDRGPIRKAVGLVDLNFHGVRHTAGNLLPALGPCVPSKFPVPFEVLAATLNG